MLKINSQLRGYAATDNTKAHKIVIHDFKFEISNFTLEISAVI